ncbi:hypothetical protein [Thermotoga sp. KOL6]|uniref:hypothetical protein n=1 Tax=Thermotoga sp. KOL6 TaxID=126741 RepID=UPI001E47C6AF|nr:hypothetical protein [Thermotoga sp. KOL6]
MLQKRSLYFLILVLCFVGNLVGGVLHFEHADILYPNGYYNTAILVGNIFEKIRPEVIELVGNDPGRITIVLKEKGTVSNGYTMPFPHKTIVIYMWPPEGWYHFQLPLEDWYTYVLIHEFSHMCHLTYQDELEKLITNLMGIPFYPQLFSGLVEGVSVFNESAFSKSSGRLNNPFFSQGLFYYSLQNFPSFNYKEIEPDDDFRNGLLYYNFTAGFYEYLVETYGLEKVKEFFRESSKPFGGIILTFEGYKDFYEKVFGKTLEKIYMDWISSLTKLEYNRDDLFYRAENTRFYKIDFYKKNLVILSKDYGPSTSYTELIKESLKFINLNGSKTLEIPLRNVVDVKYDGEKIYALCKALVFDRYENVLWDVVKKKIVAKGNISCFGVHNGRIYTVTYNTKTMKSKIAGPNFEYTFDGFIRYIDVTENFVAFLTLDNKLIVIDMRTGNPLLIIDNGKMKGPYVRFWKNGVTFIQIEDNYTLPYYYDLKSKKLYKLAEKTLLSDFVILNNDLYYIGYAPSGKTGGMGIYRKSLEIQPETIFSAKKHSFDIKERKYGVSNEIMFRLKKFLIPTVRIPLFFDDKFSMLLGFSNVENDTHLFLLPSIGQGEKFSQHVGFITTKENFTAAGWISCPNWDYRLELSLVLGEISLSPSSRMHFIFDLSIGSTNTILSDISLKTGLNDLAFGFDIESYIFNSPFSLRTFLSSSTDDVFGMFSPNSFYLLGRMRISFGKDSSFSAKYRFKLDLRDYNLDLSIASTLFQCQMEFPSGLVRNIGNTLGMFSNSYDGFILYDHGFLETYMNKFKFYLMGGVYVCFPREEKLFSGFYIGVSTSPHGFSPILIVR